MDTTNQWTQEIGGLKPMGEIASSTCSRPVVQERKVRPQKDQALNCPRCQSTNTKFCYYNNYSLTQPRYFCKTCRRYWTKGGTLRNVPVGGGSRKNKRSTTTTSSHKLPDLNPPNIPQFASQNPKIHPQGQDLNLGFPAAQDYHGHASKFFELPKIDSSGSNQLKSSSSAPSTSTTFAALELLRTGIVSRGMNSFITSTTPAPDLNALYNTSGFSFQKLKPAAVSFSVDHGLGSRYVNVPSGIHENGGRLMFPFGAIFKQGTSASEADQNKGQSNSSGYWNGMLGGGSWM